MVKTKLIRAWYGLNKNEFSEYDIKKCKYKVNIVSYMIDL